jgi:hypothetical protein
VLPAILLLALMVSLSLLGAPRLILLALFSTAFFAL